MPNLELILTRDGSHSLYNSSLDETYHSMGGALEESEFIYIDAGLKPLIRTKSKISILEIGFGTGLNAILTLRESISNDLDIYYETLEPFPLTDDIISKLNYPELLKHNYLKEMFYNLHDCGWEKEVKVNENFQFIKKTMKIEDFSTSKRFDLVYFDAFAPSKQADIWNIINLEKMKEMLVEEGVLITYCSSGQFKRDLKSIGFLIENLPGPFGKREITRAIN